MAPMNTNIKTLRVADQAANILAAVEAILMTDGRPRKMPYKDRPVATSTSGRIIKKVTKADVWGVDKLSLLGAFQLARIEEGATPRTMRLAMCEFIRQYWGMPNWGRVVELETDRIDNEVKRIDNDQLDTRRLARDARAARRKIEKRWPQVATSLRKEVNA